MSYVPLIVPKIAEYSLVMSTFAAHLRSITTLRHFVQCEYLKNMIVLCNFFQLSSLNVLFLGGACKISLPMSITMHSAGLGSVFNAPSSKLNY